MTYKIPFRPIYVSTLRQWIAESALCHVVYRLSPPPIALTNEPAPRAYEVASLENHIAGLREMLKKADSDVAATRRERDIYARGLLDITLKTEPTDYAHQIAANAIASA